MTTTKKTRGQQTNSDIEALVRARNTLLWIVTREEARVERAIFETAGGMKYLVRYWDSASGLTEIDRDGNVQTLISSEQGGDNPLTIFRRIRQDKTRCIYIFRDLPTSAGAQGGRWSDVASLRAVKTVARELQTAEVPEARVLVLLTSSNELPPELSGTATVLDYPIPDRVEIGAILDDTVEMAVPEDKRGKALAGGRDAIVDAAVGLTSDEAANCFAKSLVTLGKIDPATVSDEKKRVIQREKVLTWYDRDPRGLEAIGGLDVLKDWLKQRKLAFSPKAREYGLPHPKGILLVGPPGTGKSLTAKCAATVLNTPLLRLDLGALKSKWVGESEANIRKALQVAETVSPVVVWVDEIEKALQGATGGANDGGVSADSLGVLLSWMQEQKGVFVMATANDVRALPPELLRKGRFDEIFWVDLPTQTERAEILSSALRQYSRDPKTIDLAAVAAQTNGFTGAEIAAVVPEALFAAFADGEREITTKDIIAAAKTVVPLAETAKEKLEALRTWANGKARLASKPEKQVATRGRNLEM